MRLSEEARETVCNFYEALRAGDAGTIEEVFGEVDILFVGTNGNQWLTDPANLRASFEEHFEASGGVSIFDEDPTAYSEGVGYSDGDVGWFHDRPSLRLPSGEIVALRHTGVLRRVGGGWRIVQSHLSVGSDVIMGATSP
jgi:ketosteroid isomerase-like protein